MEGREHFYVVRGGDRAVPRAAWGYAEPAPVYRALSGLVAFYPAVMDGCWVDGELARPQPGGFYGDGLTKAVHGPLKGEPGSDSWCRERRTGVEGVAGRGEPVEMM